MLAKDICFDESCAFREGNVSESGLWHPKEPKSYSCTDMPRACWGLGRRNSSATDLFRDIHQNCNRTPSKMCLGEHFSWPGSSLPSSSYLGSAHWLLSQLAYFVCSDCKRKSPSSQEFASATKQSAVLTSQEIFWFEKDIMSQRETLDLKGNKSVQQARTPASVFLVSYTSVDN